MSGVAAVALAVASRYAMSSLLRRKAASVVVAPMSRSRLCSLTVSKSISPRRVTPAAANRTEMSRPTLPSPTTMTERRVRSACTRGPQQVMVRTWLMRGGGGGTSWSFHEIRNCSPITRTFSLWLGRMSPPTP